MSGFMQAITAFCAACVFIGALYIICPEGEMNKSVKYLLSLCFLISIIAAAGVTIKRLDIQVALPEQKVLQAEDMEIYTAEFVYKYALEKAGINFSKITVCTDKTEDGSIVISKVIIYSDCEKEKILLALGQAAENFEVEIINE